MLGHLANPLMYSFKKGTHAQPQIVLPVPVFVLSTTDLGGQRGARGFCILVPFEAFLDELPGTVNDFCAGLSLDFTAIRQVVGGQLDAGGALPHILAGLHDAFFWCTTAS